MAQFCSPTWNGSKGNRPAALFPPYCSTTTPAILLLVRMADAWLLPQMRPASPFRFLNYQIMIKRITYHQCFLLPLFPLNWLLLVEAEKLALWLNLDITGRGVPSIRWVTWVASVTAWGEGHYRVADLGCPSVHISCHHLLPPACLRCCPLLSAFCQLKIDQKVDHLPPYLALCPVQLWEVQDLWFDLQGLCTQSPLAVPSYQTRSPGFVQLKKQLKDNCKWLWCVFFKFVTAEAVDVGWHSWLHHCWIQGRSRTSLI